MPEKVIRDPVHDVIAFQLEKPLDALLFSLLNAEEFQRLRRIRQLGMASLVYPGADHSRYAHSLGVMETARKILDQLRRTLPLDEEAEIVCVVTRGKSPSWYASTKVRLGLGVLLASFVTLEVSSVIGGESR